MEDVKTAILFFSLVAVGYTTYMGYLLHNPSDSKFGGIVPALILIGVCYLLWCIWWVLGVVFAGMLTKYYYKHFW